MNSSVSTVLDRKQGQSVATPKLMFSNSDYRSFTKSTRGGWRSTDIITKFPIGLAIHSQGCLVVIQTGEDQFVSRDFRVSGCINFTRYSGLATNFLLIESLQRFYQYYGDDLQVGKIGAIRIVICP